MEGKASMDSEARPPRNPAGRAGPGPEKGKTRFVLRGLEMIDKVVSVSGNSGRVYLPLDWSGKRVKIIRVD